jgi:hypothetical protein
MTEPGNDSAFVMKSAQRIFHSLSTAECELLRQFQGPSSLARPRNSIISGAPQSHSSHGKTWGIERKSEH